MVTHNVNQNQSITEPENLVITNNKILLIKQLSLLLVVCVISGIALIAGYKYSIDHNLNINFPINEKPPETTNKTYKIPRNNVTPTPIPFNTIDFLTENNGALTRLNQIKTNALRGGYDDTIAYDGTTYLYYFHDDNLVQYDLDTNTITQTIDSLPLSQDSVTYYLEYTDYDNSLWLITVNDIEGTTRLISYSLNKDNLTVAPIKNVFDRTFYYAFYGSNRPLGMQDNILYLINGGGDGCGSYGTLLSLNNPTFNHEQYNKSTTSNLLSEITNTGGGCDNNPRFLGFIPSLNSYAMYDVVPDSYDNSPITQMFLYNYLDHSKKTIHSPENRSESNTEVLLAPTQDKIALVATDSATIVPFDNPTSATILKLSSSIPLRYNQLTWQADNKLYQIANNIYQVNLDSGTVNTITYSKPNPYTPDPIILGIYNNKPLFVQSY